MKRCAVLILVAVVGCGSPPVPEKEGPKLPLSFDYLQSMPPPGWIEKPPRIGEHMAVFQVPRARHDPEDGDLTVSKGLGDSVEKNLARWKGQFEPVEMEKIEEFKVAGCQVTYLDISGTYLHRARPFDQDGKPTPPTPKEGFRMLAAHFQGPRNAYQVAFRGPKKTIEENKQAFDDWLKGFK